MQKTRGPTVAGIICIVVGNICVFFGTPFAELFLSDERSAWVGAIMVLFVIGGMTAISGGGCALKRRIWGLALAGTICCACINLPWIFILLWLFPSVPVPAIIGFLILGILPIVLVVLGKREFR